MRLIYRPIEVWPGERTNPRKPMPFDRNTTWTSTLDLLERELRALRVGEAILQVDSPSERDFRLDGGLRADARLASPAVILSFDAPRIGKLSYPCDTFTRAWSGQRLEGWQANVRAIALGLEALRKVERYGITQTGQQYTGWKQLGTGVAMSAGGPKMTADQAARFIADHAVVILDGGSEHPWGPEHKGYYPLLKDRAEMERAYRLAAKSLHPDVAVTGSKDLFQKLEEAHRLLQATID